MTETDLQQIQTMGLTVMDHEITMINMLGKKINDKMENCNRELEGIEKQANGIARTGK